MHLPQVCQTTDTFSDGLSLNGQAPRVFSRTTKRGLPWVSVTFCSLFSLLAYMAISTGPGKGWTPDISLMLSPHLTLSLFSLRLVPEHDLYCRFNDLVRNLRGTCLFKSFSSVERVVDGDLPCIIIQTYLRFRAGWNAQGLDRDLLPFKSSLQPYAAWYGLIMISIVLLFSGFSVFLRGSWDTADFVTNYIPLIFAPILFSIASYVMKSKFVRVEDMDFVTGVDEVIAETYDEPPPKNIWEKFWLWIVSALSITYYFLPESMALLACVYSSR